MYKYQTCNLLERFIHCIAIWKSLNTCKVYVYVYVYVSLFTPTLVCEHICMGMMNTVFMIAIISRVSKFNFFVKAYLMEIWHHLKIWLVYECLLYFFFVSSCLKYFTIKTTLAKPIKTYFQAEFDSDAITLPPLLFMHRSILKNTNIMENIESLC